MDGGSLENTERFPWVVGSVSFQEGLDDARRQIHATSIPIGDPFTEGCPPQTFWMDMVPHEKAMSGELRIPRF